MTQVDVHGQLVCADEAQAASLAAHLAHHAELTRAEPGCVQFQVVATDDPLVWQVDEVYAGPDAFRAHQARLAGGEWAAATVGIERRYTITGLD